MERLESKIVKLSFENFKEIPILTKAECESVKDLITRLNNTKIYLESGIEGEDEYKLFKKYKSEEEIELLSINYDLAILHLLNQDFEESWYLLTLLEGYKENKVEHMRNAIKRAKKGNRINN